MLPLGGAKRASKKDAKDFTKTLIRFAQKGDHVQLERHLEAGASPNTLDREGTLLTHAAAAGHTETISVVLKYSGTEKATIDRQVRASARCSRACLPPAALAALSRSVPCPGMAGWRNHSG